MAPKWLQTIYFIIGLGVLGAWARTIPQRQAQALSRQKQTKGPARIGHKAPSFQMKTPTGEVVSLEQYRGRWVLLNFWATWCPPCRDEMPSMERLAQKMKGKPFVLLAASVDASWHVVRRFFQNHATLRSNALHIQLLWDPGAVTSLRYGTSKFPETYLIDPKGIVRMKFIGPKAWDKPKMMSTINQWIQ